MAAKTVLNYLERDSVIHKMTGTTKLAVFPALYLCQHDYIQHLGIACIVCCKSCCI